MAFKSYREESKTDWGTHQIGSLNLEQINTGAILRIADATEKMAGNYTALQNKYESEKERAERYREYWHKEQRRVTALKGVITKLRKKL